MARRRPRARPARAAHPGDRLAWHRRDRARPRWDGHVRGRRPHRRAGRRRGAPDARFVAEALGAWIADQAIARAAFSYVPEETPTPEALTRALTARGFAV